jgi:hypothetical protein
MTFHKLTKGGLVTDCDQLPLFKELPEAPIFALPLRRLKFPVWTENKARLIERYLYYFVLVTKHGTYIDGFAGPQETDLPDMWSAKMVLESEPRWLKHFFLFEKDPKQIDRVQQLADSQPPRARKENRRDIHVIAGDFNESVHKLLGVCRITGCRLVVRERRSLTSVVGTAQP